MRHDVLWSQYVIGPVCTGVDGSRKDSFTKKGRTIDSIPPTSVALYQHIKEMSFQADYSWQRSPEAQRDLPIQTDQWGWVKSE